MNELVIIDGLSDGESMIRSASVARVAGGCISVRPSNRTVGSFWA